MCLDSVYKDEKLPSGEINAWKVYRVGRGGGLRPEYYHPKSSIPYGSGRIERGKWYEAQNWREGSTTWGFVRPIGFHAFRYKKDAEKWAGKITIDKRIVVKVRIRGVFACGGQFRWVGEAEQLFTWIAKEMMILKEGG